MLLRLYSKSICLVPRKRRFDCDELVANGSCLLTGFCLDTATHIPALWCK